MFDQGLSEKGALHVHTSLHETLFAVHKANIPFSFLMLRSCKNKTLYLGLMYVPVRLHSIHVP